LRVGAWGRRSLVITPRKQERSDDEAEQRVFTSLGLTEQEWDVYTFLCKTGPLKAIDIARNLGINRVLIYVYLKHLQRKGLVEATLGVPQKFLAVSPKEMMNFCIENKKDELREMVKDSTLISQVLSHKAESFIPEERLALMQGVSRVFPRIRRMINECNSEFLWMLSTRQNESLQWESVERFIEIASNKPNIVIKIIVNFWSNAHERARIIEISKNYDLKLELRHATFENTFRPSEFVIRDKKEGFFTLSSMHLHIKKEEETGLWTNNKSLIETLVFLFDKVWFTSSPLCLSEHALSP
jgi:sugar-specific transcriptional regulator TrmB